MLALAGVGDPADENDEGVDVDGMTYEELTELGEHIGVQSRGRLGRGGGERWRDSRLARRTRLGRKKHARRLDENLDDESCAVAAWASSAVTRASACPGAATRTTRSASSRGSRENKCCPLCKPRSAEAEASGVKKRRATH